MSAVALSCLLLLVPCTVPLAGCGAGARAGEAPPYKMRRLPAGSFIMGSPDDGREADGDEPQHPVRLTWPFLLGRAEVTQALYEAVMGALPELAGKQDVPLRGPNLPVRSVSWLDAARFCNALSRLEGLPPAYRIQGPWVSWETASTGYRLPTEAEWEYAARASTTLRFSGTDREQEVCDYANVGDRTLQRLRPGSPMVDCDDGVAGLAAVASYRPNAWGLYDMTGNAWEWVWDLYGQYQKSPVRDPVGPESGPDGPQEPGPYRPLLDGPYDPTCSVWEWAWRRFGPYPQVLDADLTAGNRVPRGGSWADDAVCVRNATREDYPPMTRRNDLGLRLARSIR